MLTIVVHLPTPAACSGEVNHDQQYLILLLLRQRGFFLQSPKKNLTEKLRRNEDLKRFQG